MSAVYLSWFKYLILLWFQKILMTILSMLCQWAGQGWRTLIIRKALMFYKGVLMRSSRTWSRMYWISEDVDDSPYALPVGRPGLEEPQDFVVFEVLMFYPDEEQLDLIRITETWEQISFYRFSAKTGSEVRTWELIRLSDLSVLDSSEGRTWEQISLCDAQPGIVQN